MTIEDKEIWDKLLRFLEQTTGKKPKDLNGVLFLIGVQELGKGALRFEKEQKQDLLHIAICKVLSLDGYYRLAGTDQEGWPHWEKLKELPNMDLLAQENLLKHYIIRYFREEVGLHI
ncbi:hypothetical protein Lbys_2594 [Leadbetterella byssophila DSM 17132]|uniref:Uncharacterized protein n=1 Tax=Leadbetterella byssophila (strain DSM 17132 / JCM 16389 / KACC 11308 / NBRC 106382 / 4M15) TaxID=649349 RepID=E4RZL3_LEAB4|nr:hypothetical protein [Leadbetterella byssophila]ADQ18256.1 hypothetical protein Lbys_2594 [Leadbetterella byssophila DSM 17132]